MKQSYDLIAIGGGSGGISIVERAAAYGAKCALIEQGAIGGTCVNVGCVPKKILWNAASMLHSIHNAPHQGFKLHYEGFDWQQLTQQYKTYIGNVHHWYDGYLEKLKIERFQGKARFVDEQTVVVNGQTLQARHIVIATGGRPAIPAVEGAELGMTSDDFFTLSAVPKSMIIVGAGYIAVELAQLLRTFDCQVTLITRGDGPLRQHDALIREVLLPTLEKDGIRLLTHRHVQRVNRRSDGQLEVTTQQEQLTAESLLWAIGRTPNTEDIGLEHTGVTVQVDGTIPTNLQQETNVDGIYALGDIGGKFPLTPVAIAAARRLGDRLFGGKPERYLPYENIASVVFSHPPIGTVGLTETAAREIYDEIRVYTSRFTPMSQSFMRDPRETAMKLVCAGSDERIVGVHMIGDGADEILQGFAVAVHMKARKCDLDETVAIHPTSAEELVTMR